MNQLMGIDFKKLASVDANKLVDSMGSLNCTIEMGGAIHDTFDIHWICIASSTEDLQRIAIALLACAIGTQHQTYLPISTESLTENESRRCSTKPLTSFGKGIRITAARPSIDQPKSFTYTPKRKLKRYPWYPWSLTCDAQTELPVFTPQRLPGVTSALM
nr:hypothetical protein [Verminephrobacter eiseniae]